MDNTIYLDLFFDSNGVLTGMGNNCKVKKTKNISKSEEIDKVLDFAKTFLNTDVIYTNKKDNIDKNIVIITKDKLPERYESSTCMSAYKDSLGNVYLFNRESGMVVRFYMD